MTTKQLLTALAFGLTAAGIAACETTEPRIDADPPENLDARYEWELVGFQGTEAVGAPTVHLTWDLPAGWNGEEFRVYGRVEGQGSFLRIATVTSCGAFGCVYTDANVSADRSYEFYVATVGSRDREARSAGNVAVFVPPANRPPRPVTPVIIASDRALFLYMDPDEFSAENFWKYKVFLVEIDGRTEIDGEPIFYQVGETDGDIYADGRVENDVEYGYRVAQVDLWGHVSDLSGVVRGTPRAYEEGPVIVGYPDTPGLRGWEAPDAEILVRGTDQDGREVILYRRDDAR